MQKRAVGKGLRNVLIIGGVLCALAAAAFLIVQLRSPLTKEETVPLYSYSSKAVPTYDVRLKKNILYEQAVLPQDGIYLTEFVNEIRGRFQYVFSGERPAAIRGDFEVYGLMEGYVATNERDKTRTIWQKRYSIVPKTAFSREDAGVSVIQEVPLKYAEYKKYAEAVMENARIKSGVRMSVMMNVNLSAQTDSGTIEEKTSQGLVFPLTDSFFEIAKKTVEEEQRALTETRITRLTPGRAKISALTGLVLLLLCGTGCLYFYTTPVSKDPKEKKIKQILKKYGSRLVTISGESSLPYDHAIGVKTFEDLIRIADEAGKTVMYKEQAGLIGISRFYLLDSDSLYVYELQNQTEGRGQKNRPAPVQPLEA